LAVALWRVKKKIVAQAAYNKIEATSSTRR